MEYRDLDDENKKLTGEKIFTTTSDFFNACLEYLSKVQIIEKLPH